MGIYTEKAGTNLNNLLEMITDAEKGFLKAALDKYKEVLGNTDLLSITAIFFAKKRNFPIANLKTVKVMADVD